MKNEGIQIGVIFAIMLLMAATAMPAIACDCEDMNKVDRNDLLDSLNIENKLGSEKLGALISVITNKDARSIIKDLNNKGYKLQYDKANVQKISDKKTESQEALMVIIPAESKENSNTAQVVFASNKNKTSVANAIIEDGENYRKIYVCEIDNGIEKNYVVENRAGIISVDGKTISTEPQELQTKSYDKCDICTKACTYMYGGGCALTGYFACISVCACFTGPNAWLCPPTCGIVYAVICIYGSDNSCSLICEDYC